MAIFALPWSFTAPIGVCMTKANKIDLKKMRYAKNYDKSKQQASTALVRSAIYFTAFLQRL